MINFPRHRSEAKRKKKTFPTMYFTELKVSGGHSENILFRKKEPKRKKKKNLETILVSLRSSYPKSISRKEVIVE